jgi:DNA polymerase-1
LQSPSQILDKLLELGVPVDNVRKETLALQDDPVCQLFSKLNSLAKNQTTYCTNLIPTINKHTNRSHPNIFQLANITGRMKTAKTKDENNKSKNTLPLLTIPRNPRYRKILKCAKDEYYYLDTDYSQIESRLVAWASQCPTMLDAFNTGKCVYTVTVSKINNLEYEEFNSWRKDERHEKHKYAKGLRQNGKGLVLGLQFGMGIKRYKDYVRDLFQLFKTINEAEKDRQAFFNIYPEVKQWHNRIWKKYENSKYIQNVNGRILYWKDKAKYNVSINYPIQSLAGDIIKVTATRLFRELKQTHGLPLFDRASIYLIALIHDAITLEGRLDLLETFKPVKQKIMEDTAYEIVNTDSTLLPIKFGSESKIGKNMAEAH